jgi:hypothetical protein
VIDSDHSPPSCYSWKTKAKLKKTPIANLTRNQNHVTYSWLKISHPADIQREYGIHIERCWPNVEAKKIAALPSGTGQSNGRYPDNNHHFYCSG